MNLPNMADNNRIDLPLGISNGSNLHLLIDNGLNLKAICSNSDCLGSKSRTWICLGYGTFDIAK
jgi:hypothetical protein